MNAKPKKKMCWNCEGNVNLHAEVCPYCRTSLKQSPENLKSSSADPYPPPTNFRIFQLTLQSLLLLLQLDPSKKIQPKQVMRSKQMMH